LIAETNPIYSTASAIGTRELGQNGQLRETRRSRLHGLRPRGTLYFLFVAIRDGEITFDEFLELLEILLDEGFYLDEAVYLEAIREARRLAAEHE
jgi:hypothetical protein